MRGTLLASLALAAACSTKVTTSEPPPPADAAPTPPPARVTVEGCTEVLDAEPRYRPAGILGELGPRVPGGAGMGELDPGTRVGVGVGPRVELDGTDVSGELTQEAARAALARDAIPRLQRCYVQVLGRDPSFEREVPLRFVVAADGRLASVSQGAGDPSLAQCMEEALRGVRFPRANGPTTIGQSFAFTLPPGRMLASFPASVATSLGNTDLVPCTGSVASGTAILGMAVSRPKLVLDVIALGLGDPTAEACLARAARFMPLPNPGGRGVVRCRIVFGDAAPERFPAHEQVVEVRPDGQDDPVRRLADARVPPSAVVLVQAAPAVPAERVAQVAAGLRRAGYRRQVLAVRDPAGPRPILRAPIHQWLEGAGDAPAITLRVGAGRRDPIPDPVAGRDDLLMAPDGDVLFADVAAAAVAAGAQGYREILLVPGGPPLR